jgi:hypothetical protein
LRLIKEQKKVIAIFRNNLGKLKLSMDAILKDIKKNIVVKIFKA